MLILMGSLQWLANPWSVSVSDTELAGIHMLKKEIGYSSLFLHISLQ